MYLLDTNVISELRKGGRANHGVTAFFATLAAEDIYLSVVTIGEIRRGLENVRARFAGRSGAVGGVARP